MAKTDGTSIHSARAAGINVRAGSSLLAAFPNRLRLDGGLVRRIVAAQVPRLNDNSNLKRIGQGQGQGQALHPQINHETSHRHRRNLLQGKRS